MYRDRGVLDEKGTLKDMILKLSKIPLLYQPGEKWHYSVSAHALGYIVEVISKKSLDKFFKERIFEPLVMKDTGFYVPKEKIDRFSSNYRVDKEGNLKVVDSPKTSSFSAQVSFSQVEVALS